MRIQLVFGWVVAMLAQAQGAWGALRVETDFPGGSVNVITIDQATQTLTFGPVIPPNGGWKTWWCFKVEGIEAGKAVILQPKHFQANSLRPVFSEDGKTWNFVSAPLDKGQVINGTQAWFAWYVPYVLADSEKLVAEVTKGCKFAERFELCKSEGGLPVVGLKFSEPGVEAAERVAIWIHARQHAWEAGGSWTADGVARWLGSEDPKAAALRQRAEIYVVPIMDLDSVEKGLGGKDQKPHDHNRDWLPQPVWNSVKAAMAHIKRLDAEGRLVLFLDLHDPGWGGASVEFWGRGYKQGPAPRRVAIDAFLDTAKKEMTGPGLAFTGVIKGDFDKAYTPTTPTSGLWVRNHTRETVVAGVFEIPIVMGKVEALKNPPPQAHWDLGAQLGKAIERHLRENQVKAAAGK